jgi:hypothetical protein
MDDNHGNAMIELTKFAATDRMAANGFPAAFA